MERLIKWLIARYLPGYHLYNKLYFRLVVKPVNEIVIKELIREYCPACHLAKNPPKGRRKAKEIIDEA